MPFNNEMSVALAIVCLITILAALPACSTLPLDGAALGALKSEEACSCNVEVSCH